MPIPPTKRRARHRNSLEAAAERFLKQAQERQFWHTAAWNSSDDAIVAKTPNGVILAWNPGAHRMLGYSEREVIGKLITVIIPSQSRDQEKQILKRLRSGERIEHYETVRVSKDGKKIDVSVTIIPLKDAEGCVIAALSIARNITENRRAQAALRDSEERLRLAMNNVASGLFTLDLQGLVTYVNPSAEKMVGWTSAELLGKKMHDVIHYKRPDGSPFPASECECLQALQKGIELREHEDNFIQKDGCPLPVIVSASPLKKEGAAVGMVVGFRDDTQRRVARLAPQENEERFRLVANTAPVMIWMSDVDKRCTYFNQPWLDFTGRSLEAELGNGWAEGVHPEDLRRCLDTYTKAFDRCEPYHVEYQFRRHDGQYRWIFSSGVPRFDADGSFTGYIGSAIDVTIRKLAEEALSEVSQRLIQAHEEERAKIARELHDDINQRLVLLSINLDQLKPSLRAAAPKFRKDIEELIKEVRDLASDIHGLSHRLHSSKLEYLGLAAAAGSFCRELSGRQQVKIDFHAEGIPKELPKEISLCVYRVLQEALQNALKHSGSGHFEVSLRSESSEIQLAVRDWGIGFDLAVARQGHGIGLTSMTERLKLVDGELSIETQPQSGTTIHARVPLKERTKVTGAGR